MAPADFSPIYLVDGATGSAVAAELRQEIGAAQLTDWVTKWQPAVHEIMRELIAKGVPQDRWPQSSHWRWDQKVARVSGLLAHKGFSVTATGVCQGLMQVKLTQSARLPEQHGKPLVYVEYLETAPWNRSDCVPVRRFKGVGTALLTAAVALSEQETFKGRIGLHSLPQADEFYQDLGMCDLGPDPHYPNQLRYFEFTAEQAAAFLV